LQLERAKFLSSLSHRIARPILPDDELSEYLVTQAIADFLATELKLDGVIYRSAQSKDGTNVALFHHASCVAPHSLPKGTELNVYTHASDEDGPYRSFTVHERVPVPPEQEPKPKPTDFWDFYVGSDVRVEPGSPPYLKLDMESLRIYQVNGVAYTTEEFAVSRYRWPKQDVF
jgi:hypothetical protein